MAATHAEMAHELRGALVAGEPCPVCAQEVHQVPKAGAAPKVKAAESAARQGGEDRGEGEDRAGSVRRRRRISSNIGRRSGRRHRPRRSSAGPGAGHGGRRHRLAHRHQGSARRMARRGGRPTVVVRGARGRAHRCRASRGGRAPAVDGGASRSRRGGPARRRRERRDRHAGEPAVGGVGPPRGGPRRRRGAGGDRFGVRGDPRGTVVARHDRCRRPNETSRPRAWTMPRARRLEVLSARGTRARRRFPPRAGRGRRGAWRRRRTGDGARGTDRVRERPGTDDPRPRGRAGTSRSVSPTTSNPRGSSDSS